MACLASAHVAAFLMVASGFGATNVVTAEVEPTFLDTTLSLGQPRATETQPPPSSADATGSLFESTLGFALSSAVANISRHPTSPQPRDVITSIDTGGCGPLNLGDRVWRDLNGDSRYDGGLDEGLAGASVQLWRRIWFHDPIYVGRDITDSSGKYTFSCLDEGEYIVAVEGIGNYRAATVLEPDPDTNLDHVNNCFSTPPFTPPSGFPIDPLGVTDGIILNVGFEPPVSWDGDGTNGNRTLDCGFTCDEENHDVVLVIDRSASMKGEIQAAQKAASDFVLTMNPANQRAAIVTFSSSATSLGPLTLTNDQAALESVLSSKIGTGGDTNIAAGINKAAAVLTAGGHGTSGMTAQPIVTMLALRSPPLSIG